MMQHMLSLTADSPNSTDALVAIVVIPMHYIINHCAYWGTLAQLSTFRRSVIIMVRSIMARNKREVEQTWERPCGLEYNCWHGRMAFQAT